jgi:hypothetical protein
MIAFCHQLNGGQKVQTGNGAHVFMKAEVGFMNEKPAIISKASIYVVLVAETSDGKLLHFARIE